MRFGVENKDKEINTTLNFLYRNSKKEIEIFDSLVKLLKKNVSSSDIFFITLKELQKRNLISGKKGKVKIFELDRKELEEIKKIVEKKVYSIKKFFFTPLEIAKFYQCPRRLWLEKVVLSKQFKERKGKVWDGEAIHYATRLFVTCITKETSLRKVTKDVAEKTISTFKDRITLSKESIRIFLEKLFQFFSKENFVYVFAEKTLESFQLGLVGTPDLIGIRENGEVVSMDIKAGKIKGGRIKEEHLLQNVGESILVENFFRRKAKECYLIYFLSSSVAKIRINEDMKKSFLKYRKLIIKTLSSEKIPPKSKLPNFRKRVCKGCHVKPACDNIEFMRKFKKRKLYGF